MSWPPFCVNHSKKANYHTIIIFIPKRSLIKAFHFGEGFIKIILEFIIISHLNRKKKKNNCFKHLQMKETAHPTIPPSKKSIPTASLQGHLSLQLRTGLQGWLLRTSSLKEEPSWKPRNEPVGIPQHHSQHRPSSGLSFCIISISFFQKKHGTWWHDVQIISNYAFFSGSWSPWLTWHTFFVSPCHVLWRSWGVV